MEGGTGTSASTSRPCSSTFAGALQEQFDGFAITKNPDKVNANSVRVNAGEHDNGGSFSSNGSQVVTVTGSKVPKHPLLIEVVLRNISTHFSGLEPLLQFRLVCRTWRDVFLSTWRSSATPKIVYSKHNRTYSLNDEDQTPLGEFLEFWDDQCQTTPYRQVHLEHWIFAERKLGFVTDDNRFWDVVGGYLTKLTLEHCTSAISKDFLRLINRSCPNLETLILQDCSFRGLGIRNQIEQNCSPADYKRPTEGEHRNLKSLHIICTGEASRVFTSLRMTYMELLSNFPCLTSVHMRSYVLANEILYFLRAVKKIRMEDPGKLPITLLATGSPARIEFLGEQQDENEWFWEFYEEEPPPPAGNGEMIKLLRELHIPLQSIELTWDLSLVEIQHLVESSATSLTTLIAFDYRCWEEEDPVADRWVPRRCNFSFGVNLENLQELHMLEGFCKSLEFLKSTPNLKSLRIRNPYEYEHVLRQLKGRETVLFANSPISEMSSVKLPNLTVFELDHAVRGEDLQSLVQWMPNVRRVQMFLNDNQFTMVCQTWKELTELKVLGGDLTDAGVMGRNYQPGALCSSWNLENGEAFQPNISCLQRLEVFKALVAPLTGASVFHGFLKLSSLRQIYFPTLGKVGDDKAKDALLAKGVKISRQDWSL